MFFEGSEKKAELIVDSTKLSLLNDFDDDFWAELVSKCHAKILSSTKNKYCKAYLLSESSLFVWDDHFLILTCGETSLIHAVEFFIQNVSQEHILQLIFQRKNEYFAHAQPSCFLDDVKVIENHNHVTGCAYRFGALDSHHTYIYHLDRPYTPDPDDKTYELLAYQISNKASKMLCTHGLKAGQIRAFLRLDELLPGFALDDFVFDPYGYSLNAINNTHYLTIHVTPQENSSYVSFESNLNLIEMAPIILDTLEPASFDLVTFNEKDFAELNAKLIPDHYISKELVEKQLSCEYLVSFANYIRPTRQFTLPSTIDITGENYAF